MNHEGSSSFSGLHRQRAVNCAFVFLSVFTILCVLKSDFIVNEIMIADDLTLYSRVKMEGLTNPHPTLPISSYLYNVTARISLGISYQVLIYLIMTSITSIFVFLWLNRYFIQNWILVSGILFSFTSPAITSVANFVSGSHGMIGFVFASLGLLLGSRSAGLEYVRLIRRIALAIGAGFSFVLAALSSPFFYIFFLSSVFYIFALYRRNVHNLKTAWILVFFILLPPLLFLYYNLVWNLYHYNNIEGWADYTVMHILERSWDYMEYTIGLYGKRWPNSWLAGGIAALCIVLMWITIKINPIVGANKFSETKMTSTTNLLVISSGFILTLIPILPATISYVPRYLFPSMIMMILIPFAVVDLMNRIHPEWFRRKKWILILFICGLIGCNFSTTYSLQNERYGGLLRYQPMLANFVQNERTNWPPGAQIVVASDIPGTFTGGYNHWSTGFLRTYTEDDAIVGVIGSEKWMRDAGDPFVEYYRHHHQQYWKTVQRDGRPFSTRRKMVGLVKSLPTYAYRFDAADGTAKRVHWLLVNASNSWSLYRMTDEGILLRGSGNSTDAPVDLDRLGIDEKDVFVYGGMN